MHWLKENTYTDLEFQEKGIRIKWNNDKLLHKDPPKVNFQDEFSTKGLPQLLNLLVKYGFAIVENVSMYLDEASPKCSVSPLIRGLFAKTP